MLARKCIMLLSSCGYLLLLGDIFCFVPPPLDVVVVVSCSVIILRGNRRFISRYKCFIIKFCGSSQPERNSFYSFFCSVCKAPFSEKQEINWNAAVANCFRLYDEIWFTPFIATFTDPIRPTKKTSFLITILPKV